MKKTIIFILGLLLICCGYGNCSVKVISDFEETGSWKPHAAPGVVLKLTSEKGKTGKSMGIDFDFTKSKGYVIAAKDVDIELPENYKLSFHIKGNAPDNTLEFKVVDKTGNTYWNRMGDFSFPPDWKNVVIRKDNIVFAWGPAPGKGLKNIKSIELAVSCGRGGKGKIYIDELTITEIPISETDIFNTKGKFKITSSNIDGEGAEAENAIDNNTGSRWRSKRTRNNWLELDMGGIEKIAGLMIHWDAYASSYDVSVSKDKRSWQKVYTTDTGDGGSDLIYFKPVDARYIKLNCRESGMSANYAVYELKIIPSKLYPETTASSNPKKAGNILDGDPDTIWTSDKNRNQNIIVDFQEQADFGGFVVHWDKSVIKERKLYVSENKNKWKEVYVNNKSISGSEYIYLDQPSGRYVKLEFKAEKAPVSIKDITVRRHDEKITTQRIFETAAKHTPAGAYPNWISHKQEYWTLTGVIDDTVESLFSEFGTVEPWHYSHTYAPFISIENKVITAADVKVEQGMPDGYLPLPEVTWKGDDVDLKIQVFSADDAQKSSTYMIYTVVNKSSKELNGKFYLAVRPFQLNPPWMFGGMASIEEIEYDASGPGMMKVNGQNSLFVPVAPSEYGTSKFGRADIYGDIVEDIISGSLSGNEKNFKDPAGLGSSALGYSFKLKPAEETKFYFAAPLHDKDHQIDTKLPADKAADYFNGKYNDTKKFWTGLLDRIKIRLPDKEFINTLKTNVAYILMNDDSYRLQPGSRNYEKSWMRDGSVTARAMLSLGFNDEVKRYLNWITKFIKDDGWVPFIVDNHDNIVTFGWKEFDSQGQYIYAIFQYYLFTRDIDFLKEKKQKVIDDIKFMKNLRDMRKTDEYLKEGKKQFYGIFPESASHEGYADSPKHSYWDDFWGIRGLKDAVRMFEILGDKKMSKQADDERKDFQESLYKSIDIVTKNFGINYIPGCAEKPWGDPTSIAIGVWPCNELENMPDKVTKGTFDIYWENLSGRFNDDWFGDFTPYEMRNAEVFMLTGQRDKLHKMLSKFFEWKRPRNWNHWAEVVTSGYRSERYLGDMPHTWIGALYVNAIRNMLIFEDGNTLYLGKGLVKEWLAAGKEITLDGMPTHFGKISYSVNSTDKDINVKIEGELSGKPKVVFVIPPSEKKISGVKLNGKIYKEWQSGEIHIKKLPAEIVIEK